MTVSLGYATFKNLFHTLHGTLLYVTDSDSNGHVLAAAVAPSGGNATTIYSFGPTPTMEEFESDFPRGFRVQSIAP